MNFFLCLCFVISIYQGKRGPHLVLHAVRIYSASKHACTTNWPGSVNITWPRQQCSDWLLAYEQTYVWPMAMARISSILYIPLGITQGEACTAMYCMCQFSMTLASLKMIKSISEFIFIHFAMLIQYSETLL